MNKVDTLEHSSLKMDSLASEMDSAKPWLPGITGKRQISNTALRKHTELLFPLPAP